MLKDMIREIWASKLSMLGTVITTASASVIILAMGADILFASSNPYRSIITYGIMPGFFVLGLLMIPLGLWLVRRKARRTGKDPVPFVIDFSRPEHRRRIILITVMTVINSVLLTVTLYEGYHFTDSVEFCGKLCHTVMKPEYTAHQRSPHARVTCAECHIGGGASWFVKSKLSGLRQVWAVMVGSYHRPIPSPHDLRPARETCEQCHWPDRFFGARVRAVYRPADDGNTDDPLVSAVALRLGGHDKRTGRFVGIHFHVSRDVSVTYQAMDEKKSQIKRVRVNDRGAVTEYVNPELPEPPAGTPWRVMDCMDCHNRPTHIYDDPLEAIDKAFMDGRIKLRMPEIRPIALSALTYDYPTAAAAETGIPLQIRKAYQAKGITPTPEQDKGIDDCAKVLKQIWDLNVFPEMKIKFGTYPDHLRHRDYNETMMKEDAGCFRCHGEKLVSAQGKKISRDCENCHETPAMGQPLSQFPEELRKMLNWAQR